MTPEPDRPESDSQSAADTRPSASGSFPTQPSKLHLPIQADAPRSRWSLRALSKRRLFVPLALAALLAGLVSLAGVLAVVVVLARTLSVTVFIESDAYQTHTRAGTVAELLDELQVVLAEGDVVDPPLTSTLQPDLHVRVERARSVTLVVDGQARLLRTTLANPVDILRGEGVNIDALDWVQIDGTPTDAADLALWPVPANRVVVRHALPLHVEDNGVTRTLHTTSESVGDALFEAGITVYLADTVTPELNTPVSADLRVKIERAPFVSIVADGDTLEVRTDGETVADALADAGIALVGLDYTIPSERAFLRSGMSIRVIRVRETVITEQEELPFETLSQADPELELDQTRVSQEGQTGLRQTQFRVRYENDIEIERVQEAARVIREPQNRIISYGTNIVLRTVDTPDGPRQYWRRLRMYATSYHPAALGGDSTTSIGRTLQRGIIAADPDILAYGTMVFVPGYGIGEMADTGGPRRRALWIDLGYSDADFRSWSRYVDVYLLTPIPAEITYVLPAE